MTDRKEIESLQGKIRARGEVCNLILDEEGRIEGVFYKGRVWGLVAFAESARTDFPAAGESRTNKQASNGPESSGQQPASGCACKGGGEPNP